MPCVCTSPRRTTSVPLPSMHSCRFYQRTRSFCMCTLRPGLVWPPLHSFAVYARSRSSTARPQSGLLATTLVVQWRGSDLTTALARISSQSCGLSPCRFAFPPFDSDLGVYRLLASPVLTPHIHLALQHTILSYAHKLMHFPRRFKVMDDERISDDLAAWACFRLDRLQPGYRFLHLYDANGVVSKGVLLVRITKTIRTGGVGVSSV